MIKFRPYKRTINTDPVAKHLYEMQNVKLKLQSLYGFFSSPHATRGMDTIYCTVYCEALRKYTETLNEIIESTKVLSNALLNKRAKERIVE